MTEPTDDRNAGLPNDFAATIYRLAINYCVDVPSEVSGALPARSHIPVQATANSHRFRTTLVPRGGGNHRLFLNGDARARAGVGEGDDVTITLALDDDPREAPIPDDLAAALPSDGIERLLALPPAMRRSMLDWLTEAKRPETRQRRIERISEEIGNRLAD